MNVRFLRRGDLLVHPEDAAVLQRHGLDSLGALMAADAPRTLAKASLPPWRERVAFDLDGRAYFVKRYRRPPVREQLRRAARGARCTAGLEWRWLARLDALGIPAPRPVACGWRTRLGVEHESVLVTAAVAGRSLESWAADGRAGPLADPNRRRDVERALGSVVRRLHGAGLFHRDLYLSHVFMALRDDGVELALIDLQRVIRPLLRRRRWRTKDLAALDHSTPRAVATRGERLRWFVRDYRGGSSLTDADRRLVRAVVRKSRRIARHSRKHGL